MKMNWKNFKDWQISPMELTMNFVGKCLKNIFIYNEIILIWWNSFGNFEQNRFDSVALEEKTLRFEIVFVIHHVFFSKLNYLFWYERIWEFCWLMKKKINLFLKIWTEFSRSSEDVHQFIWLRMDSFFTNFLRFLPITLYSNLKEKKWSLNGKETKMKTNRFFLRYPPVYSFEHVEQIEQRYQCRVLTMFDCNLEEKQMKKKNLHHWNEWKTFLFWRNFLLLTIIILLILFW